MANARPRGFNDGIIDDFRAHEGRITSGPFTGRSLLLLTTKGAKTGGERTSPLAYTRDGDGYVTVELGPEKFLARATVANDAERRRLFDQHAAKMPAFADYEKKTTRKIPVVVLERV